MGLILLAYASLLAFGFVDTLRGPYFSQIINEFSLNENTGSIFFGLTSMMVAWCSGKGGPVLRKIGAKNLLVVSAIIMALGFAVMAIAPTVVFLFCGSVLLGCGMGYASLAQNVTIMEEAPAERRSQWLSGLHTMYSLAAILAPALSHLLLAWGWGWRSSFALVAAIPSLVAVYGFWVRPSDSYSLKMKQENSSSLSWPPVSRLEKTHMILVAIVVAMYLLAEISVGTRLVRHLELHLNKSAADGSLWLMGFFTGLCLGRMMGLMVAVKEKHMVPLLVTLLLMGGLSLVGGLVLSPFGFLLNGFIMGPFYPLSIAYIRQRFGAHAPTALSYMLGIGSLTIVIMHFLIGLVANKLSLYTAMWVGPLGLGLSAWILMWESRTPHLLSSQVSSSQETSA